MKIPRWQLLIAKSLVWSQARYCMISTEPLAVPGLPQPLPAEGNGTAAVNCQGDKAIWLLIAAQKQSAHLCWWFLCCDYLSNRNWTELTGLFQSSH